MAIESAALMMTSEKPNFGPDGPRKGWNAIQDAVVSVALRKSSYAWQWCGRAIFEIGDSAIPGWADLEEDTGIAWFKPYDDSALDGLRNRTGKRGRLRPLPGLQAQWLIPRATISINQLSPFGDRVRLRFRKIVFLATEDGSAGAILRIVYRGLRLPEYTHNIFVHNSEGARRHGFTFLDALGRRFIISEVVRSDEIRGAYLAITFAAPATSQLELDALELVLFYVAGTGAVRQVVETYDSDARCIARFFHRHGHAIAEYPRPLFPSTDYSVSNTYDKVAAMMATAKSIIERGVPLRAILFHIFSGQQQVPELKLTHLAIALDALKTSVIEKIRGEGKVIPTQAEFNRRIATAIEALEREFCGPTDTDALNLIKRRLLGANDWSERERWIRFWRDVIRYQLSTEERAILQHRDVAIHVGYILKTEYDLENDDDPELDRRPYEKRLLELAVDASVFRNIMDRALLTILGYDGAFVDATDRTRLIQVRRNDGPMP